MIPSLPWRDNLREPRTLLLLAALACALIGIAMPPIPTTRNGVDVLAVVDITGSMNTRDYKVDGKPASRLEVAKAALKDMIGALPCPSRVGLALFAERTPFLLFEPVDVCKDYSAVAGAIDSIDWREAWEGDSHIAEAIYSAIDTAKGLKSDVLFITDGQEAPPLPFSGGPEFDGKRGAVRGLLVGAGGYTLSPIPKFDDRGNEIGFWAESDVPQESRFGLPPPDAANRPGYEARNAPFGGEAAHGSEHLSSVRQSYLEGIAAKTGLGYAHLDGPTGLAAALEAQATPHPARGTIDLRAIPGALALIALLAVYLLDPLRDAFRRLARHPTRKVA